MKTLFVFLALLLVTPVFAGPGNVASSDTVNGWYFWKAEGDNQDSTWTHLTDSAIVGKSSQVFGLWSYGRPNKYFWVLKLDKKYKKPGHVDFWIHLKSFSSTSDANFLETRIYVGNSEKMSDISYVEGFSKSKYSIGLKNPTGFGTTNFKGDSLDVLVFCFNFVLANEKVFSEIVFDEITFIYEDGGLIVVNDGGEPKFPRLKTTKSKINFGPVIQGAKKLDSVAIINTGDVPLQISKIWTGDSAFFAKCSLITIAPQSSTNVLVEFKQDSIPGTKKTYLRIEHNGLSKIDSIELSADFLALLPNFQLGKTEVNFGAVPNGTKKTDSVLVANTGNAQLTISRVWTSDSAFVGYISEDTINPESSAKVMVEFTQVYSSIKTAWLYIKHNATSGLDSVKLTADFLTSVKSESNLPKEFGLSQNYPNPFNPSTNIQFSIPNRQFVRLVIYNLLGEEIEVLVNGETTAGEHTAVFTAQNLPSGTYICRLQSGNFVTVKKMLLLK